jgi:RHS repeat-associated protein
VEYPVGVDHFGYDEQGRVNAEAAVLWDGVSPQNAQVRTTHTRGVGYNPAGQEISRRLPGNFELTTAYDSRGLVSRLTGGLSGENRELVQRALYDERGLARQIDQGNGVRICRTYNERGQIRGVLSGRATDVTCAAAELDRTNFGVYHVAYEWGYDKTLRAVKDQSLALAGAARRDATYDYDRIQQLVGASTALGTWQYEYDDIQNIVKVKKQQGAGPFVEQALTYGENGAGPNALTHAGATQLDYDGAGDLKSYNGYDLQFDGAGRLLKATKTGTKVLQYFYDAFGERRLLVSTPAAGAKEIHRFPLQGYEERAGDFVWHVSGTGFDVEARRAAGLRVDAVLLDELTAYVNAPANKPKPLPREWLDLDGDGDGFDAGDLAEARSAFWAGRLAGTARVSWRFVQSDHLRSSVLVTDSAGDAVATRHYEPYGATSQRAGLQPSLGYTGAAVEPDNDLGLVRMGARYYAPALGRWISPDRYIGEAPELMVKNMLESNLFSYARNNPILYRDPMGTDSIDWDSPNATDVARGASEAACLSGDRNSLRLAKLGMMKWGGLAQKMLDHYLSGTGGTVEIDLKRILDSDLGMRTSAISSMLSRVVSAKKEGMSGGQINGSTFISQGEYSVKEHQLALGGTYLYWYVDSSPEARAANKKSGTTRVVVELIDVYFWSPHDARATQCLHEAAERLKADGAKEFVQYGKTTIELKVNEDKIFKPGDGQITIRKGTTVTEEKKP